MIDSTNNSFMNCILQVLSNVPLIKKVMKKVYNIYKEYEELMPNSLYRQITCYFSKIVYLIWSGQYKAIKTLVIYYINNYFTFLKLKILLGNSLMLLRV